MKTNKEFMQIMSFSHSDKVIFITNKYQIIGTVYNCEECNQENFINLTDASICLMSDVYENSTCDSYTSSHHAWLHVNLDNVIAFSFKK